jgi:phosphomannomutase
MNQNTKILSSEIFREYDIRGTYNTNLFNYTAFLLGKALPKIINSPNICIARDGRVSSPNLTNHLIHGLLSSGINVYDLGLTATPVMYYATKKLNISAGIMVTGSHNPKEYNGFKFIINDKPFFGSDLQDLYRFIENSPNNNHSKTGNLINYSMDKAYLQFLLTRFNINHTLKIAWDPGNGATGNLVKELLYHFPGKHFLLNETIDGNFPNRPPDPSIEQNLQGLKDLVLENKCDFGIGFDGDGDRIGVIDNKGRLVAGDILTLIFAKYLLANKTNCTIIGDVKSSKILFDELKKEGHSPLMWKTGHSLIKTKMIEVGAEIAGELSGHIFFKDNHYFDDSIYAALKLCHLQSYTSYPLSVIVDSIPKAYATPEIKIECNESIKITIINKIAMKQKKDGG